MIGLASAILDSPVYGVAINAAELRATWQAVKADVRETQLRMKARGCEPGDIDGIPGRRTWLAHKCESGRLSSR